MTWSACCSAVGACESVRGCACGDRDGVSSPELGVAHEITLGIQDNYAEALFTDPTASRADILQAVAMLEDVAIAYRRILGKHHPDTAHALADLDRARMRYEDVAAP